MSSELVKNCFRKQADDSRILHEFGSEKELVFLYSYEPGIQETRQKQMAMKLLKNSDQNSKKSRNSGKKI